MRSRVQRWFQIIPIHNPIDRHLAVIIDGDGVEFHPVSDAQESGVCSRRGEKFERGAADQLPSAGSRERVNAGLFAADSD